MNDQKAKRREWPPGKRCFKHIELMQAERARATALTAERQVKALNVLNWVKFHLTSFLLELL